VNRIRQGILRSIAVGWRRTSARSWRRLPRPEGESVVFTQGPRVIRLLLVGGGLAVGYGALTQDLALGGQLGRWITNLSGRGTTIEVLARPDEEISESVALLNEVDLARFDAILTTFGGAEAATFMPAREWRAHLVSLLDQIQRSGPADLHLFVIAIPVIDGIPGFWGRLTERNVAELNATSRDVCEFRTTVTFVPLDELDPDVQGAMDRATYEAWARRIAPEVVRGLDPTALHRRRQLERVDAERERQDALDRLGVLDTERDTRFDQLVSSARNLFGVSGAGVNLIDRSRQWVKSAVGMSWLDMPRQESICDFTIRKAELMVIEDILLDERFRDGPWANGPTPIRFYAGYPIESRDGHRVGAFCVVHSQPRTFSESDAALLRELALSAQAMIWKLREPSRR
jgi:hypothetical protein